jgi:cell division protein FtsZ
MADEVLCNATRGISDLITETGVVNLDFADVKSVMKNGGDAIMGTGFGKGENGAEEAARMAINSPLLDSVSVKGATGILVNITGSQSLALRQVSKAATIVNKEAGPGAHVFLGAVINDEMKGDEIRITVIATGFNAVKPRREEKIEEKKEINFRELLSDDPVEVRLEKKEPAPEEKEEEIFLESGSIRTFNTDRFRIPTFVRKQMD